MVVRGFSPGRLYLSVEIGYHDGLDGVLVTCSSALLLLVLRVLLVPWLCLVASWVPFPLFSFPFSFSFPRFLLSGSSSFGFFFISAGDTLNIDICFLSCSGFLGGSA